MANHKVRDQATLGWLLLELLLLPEEEENPQASHRCLVPLNSASRLEKEGQKHQDLECLNT